MNRYEALRQAVEAHAGQRDKCGRDYILHPMAVTRVLQQDDRAPYGASVVALLHDIWEDTDYRIEGLSQDQTDTLYAVTRREGESYSAYIDRCAGNRWACFVKLADLWHNLQPERQSCLPEKEQASLEKRYLKARDRIWEALGYRWWPESPPTEERGT